MQKIIKALPKAEVKKELKKVRFVRKTNNANNEIPKAVNA